MQPALSHQREQSHRLQGNRLATGVWSGDNDSDSAGLHGEVQRHAPLPVEQRVPSPDDSNFPLASDFYRARADLGAVLCLCKEKVERLHQLGIGAQPGSLLRHPGGQRIKNPARLTVFFDGQAASLFLHRCDGGGFHKNGRALAGNIDYSTPELALIAALHRQDIMSSADGDVVVGQILLSALQNVVELFLNLCFQPFDLPAQAAEDGTRLIVNLLVADSGLYFLPKGREVGKAAPVGGDFRPKGFSPLQVGGQPPAGCRKAGDRRELFRQEHCSGPGQPDDFFKALHRNEGRRTASLQHRARGGRLRHFPSADILGKNRRKASKLLLRLLGQSIFLQLFQNSRKFQRFKMWIQFDSSPLSIQKYQIPAK